MDIGLSKRAQAAVRVMTRLARQPNGAGLTSDDAARAALVSGSRLPGVMRPLVDGGLVESRRGRWVLVRTPETIQVLEIVEAVDDPRAGLRCVLRAGKCPGPEHKCAVHEVWQATREAAIQALASVTLAEAAARRIVVPALEAAG